MTYSTRVFLAFFGAVLLLGGVGFFLDEIARKSFHGYGTEAMVAAGAGLGMLAAAFVRPD